MGTPTDELRDLTTRTMVVVGARLRGEAVGDDTPALVQELNGRISGTPAAPSATGGRRRGLGRLAALMPPGLRRRIRSLLRRR